QMPQTADHQKEYTSDAVDQANRRHIWTNRAILYHAMSRFNSPEQDLAREQFMGAYTNALQRKSPRGATAAPTRRARVSFGDLSSFRRKPLAYG
ncbi:MAG: hypothetical protein R6V56_04805, partial [Lentisphaeria bacterium]